MIEQYDSNNNYLGKTDFILDNMSNLTNVNIYNWQNINGVMTNQLIQTSSAQYDAKNRLYKTIGAYNQTNQLTYDNNNNITQFQDPANYLTNSNYDQLNRLTQITQADNGIVQFNYTPDNLTASIKDPKNLETIYTYDGFGRLIQLNSPDTGISIMTYDIGDNLKSSTDANLNQINYVYDEINRVVNINYLQNITLNTTFIYDNCLNGIGQLCSIQDNTGIKSYTYNDKARIQSATYQFNFNTISNKVINYSYTNKGQLESMTYPSGKVIQYSYNNNNQFSHLNVNNLRVYNSNTQQVDLVNKNILNNVQYQAFNDSPLSFDFSNNSTYSQNFNLDGEISQINYNIIDNINLNIQNDYVLDSRDNMIAINQTENQNLDPNLSSSQSYDAMSRILSQNFGVDNQSDYQLNYYTYDNSSDRLSRNTTDNTSIKHNIYEYLIVNNQASHKISKIKDNNNLLLEEFTYDNNGNTIENNQYQINNSFSILVKKNNFTYDRNNRLTQINIQDFINPNNQTVSYDINYSGQRIRKINNNQATIFIYDENSQLIAEYDQNDQIIKEYVDFSGVPVAFIQPKIVNNLGVDEMFYIYSDNLGTPRKISDQNNVLQWSWNQNEPFGDSQPIANNLEFNLRFPGQYHDSETNTNYNLFRDYNPHIGRYSQSDPIGLQGGFNSFAYSNNNPVKYFDKYGLFSSLIFVHDSLGLNHVALMINNQIYDLNPANIILKNPDKAASIIFDSIFKSVQINIGLKPWVFFNSYKKNKLFSIKFYELNLSYSVEKNLLNEIILSNNNYNIFSNNCAIFISNILENVNLKEKSFIMTPSGLEDFIMNNISLKKYIKNSYTFTNVYDFDSIGIPKVNLRLSYEK